MKERSTTKRRRRELLTALRPVVVCGTGEASVLTVVKTMIQV